MHSRNTQFENSSPCATPLLVVVNMLCVLMQLGKADVRLLIFYSDCLNRGSLIPKPNFTKIS